MKIVITVEVPDGAAVDVGTEASKSAPAAAKAKAKASAPQAATPAAAAATAPAAAAAAAPPEAPTYPKVEVVNKAVLALAGVSRDKALEVLAEFKVTRTPELKPEQYQTVIDRMEEEKARIDAAATQASLV
jgi:pyruvate dehydrogenase E2 component (dihydrolipoamide acetyltransferase)